MKRTLIILASVVIVVATMLYVGSHLSRRAASAGTASDHAPEFALKTLDGKVAHLSDYRGKAVVLNFWATWCGPCKIEMPWLVEFQKQYQPQGLVVLGVAMDDSADTKDAAQKDIRDFTTEMAVNYPILLGNDNIGNAYGGVQFLPEIFYIDRNGKIVEHSIGLKGAAEIEDNIKKIVATQVAQK